MTRAERLDALVEKLAPSARESDGRWRIKPDKAAEVETAIQRHMERGDSDIDPETGINIVETLDSKHRTAPYTIQQNENGWHILLNTDDGDVLSGFGKSIEDAISALEKKAGAK